MTADIFWRALSNNVSRLDSRNMIMKTIKALLLITLSAFLTPAQEVIKRDARSTIQSERSSRLPTAEQRTARYFETIRRSPPQQLAFFLQMPKGGDLHNHLSGSIYAESYVQWAAEKALCLSNKTFVLSLPPCDPKQDQVAAGTALTNPLLYR